VSANFVVFAKEFRGGGSKENSSLHLSSVVKSAGLNKFSYPQVPGSIPAENTSTQIHMDLSK